MTTPDDTPETEPVPATSAPSKPWAETLGVTSAQALRATGLGLVAYAITWVGAFIGSALGLIAIVLEESGTPWSFLGTVPGQVVAMAFNSPLTMTFVGEGEDGFGDGSADYGLMPLTITALALLVVVWLSRRDHARSAHLSVAGRAAVGALTAVGFVVPAWLVAFSARPSVFGVTSTAAHAELVIWGLFVVTIAAACGRAPGLQSAAAARLPAEAADAVRAAILHLAVFAGLSTVGLIVWLFVKGDAEGLLTLPLAAGNLAVAAVTFGHLGAYDGGTFAQMEGGSPYVWVFSDLMPRSVLLLVPAALVAVLLSGVVLRERSGGIARPRVATAWVVGLHAAVGVAVVALGGVSFGGFGAAADAVSPAWWFVLVMALWGALAEGVARTIAAPLSRVLPAGFRRRLAGPMAGRRASTVPDRSPVSVRTKRGALLGGGVLVLVVGSTVAITVMNSTTFGPESEALKFMENRSEAGQADVPPSGAGFDTSLLDREVIKTLAPITGVRTTGVERFGDSASVVVKYMVDGDEAQQVVGLVRSGSRWGVFDRWEVSGESYATITVTAPGATSVEVNGIEIAAEGDALDSGVGFEVLPGSYVIRPKADQSGFGFAEQSVRVQSEDAEELSFEATYFPR